MNARRAPEDGASSYLGTAGFSVNELRSGKRFEGEEKSRPPSLALDAHFRFPFLFSPSKKMALRALASRSATSGVAVTAAAAAGRRASSPVAAVVPAGQRQHRRSVSVASMAASSKLIVLSFAGFL